MARREDRMACRRLVVVVSLWLLAACQTSLPSGAEAWSLSGRALHAPELSADVQAEREAKLGAARDALAANPEDREAAIWVGRRLGYLGRYRGAKAIWL